MGPSSPGQEPERTEEVGAMKILCWLGLHRWERGTGAYCYIDWGMVYRSWYCKRCGKLEYRASP